MMEDLNRVSQAALSAANSDSSLDELDKISSIARATADAKSGNRRKKRNKNTFKRILEDLDKFTDINCFPSHGFSDRLHSKQAVIAYEAAN
jgi:hypothetical protein